MTEVKTYFNARRWGEGKYDTSYDFDEETKIGEVVVTLKKSLTPNDVESIMVTAYEGGIDYWAMLKRKTPNGDKICDILGGKPEDMPMSQWITHILLNDGGVIFRDAEDKETVETLTLKKLIKGLKMHMENKTSFELDNMDAGDADCIIQYALFGEVVYG